MDIKNRQSVRLVCRLLSITGIILPTAEENRSSLFIGLIRTCLSILTIVGATSTVFIFMYHHRHSVYEYSLGFPYIGVAFSVIVTFFAFIEMRREMNYFLLRIDQNVHTYSQEDQILTDYPWLYRESSARRIYFLVIAYEFLGVIPMIFPLIDRFVLRQTNPSLSFPLEMPWDQEKHFWATYIIQFILGMGMCWFISMIQLFVLFGVIEFSRQNMRLCEALSSIDRRTEKTFMEKLKPYGDKAKKLRERDRKMLFDYEFQTHLKECIQHHQKLVELFQIYKRWFSVLFLTELIADSSTFAIVFYNLYQVNTWTVYSGLLGSTYIFITSLFARCLVGEMFSDMNEKIVEVIFYEVPWYEQSLSTKKLLSIFHYQARRPMDLYAFSIYKASFFTFSSLIRSSYSYVNILKVTLGSKN